MDAPIRPIGRTESCLRADLRAVNLLTKAWLSGTPFHPEDGEQFRESVNRLLAHLEQDGGQHGAE